MISIVIVSVGDWVRGDGVSRRDADSDRVPETLEEDDPDSNALQLNDPVEERVADPRDDDHDGDWEIELLRDVERETDRDVDPERDSVPLRVADAD